LTPAATAAAQLSEPDKFVILQMCNWQIEIELQCSSVESGYYEEVLFYY
jgi:hypothetical protein